MTQHIYGSGSRLPLPEVPVPLCDWDFDLGAFPVIGHNIVPVISNFYLVGMPNRSIRACGAPAIFRHFQLQATATTENTWPPASFIWLDGFSLPDEQSKVIPESFPIWIPSIAGWEELNGGPGQGNADFNMWLDAICGLYHPPPNDVNDPQAHDKADYGQSVLHMPSETVPGDAERRDAQITVTVQIDGVTVGRGIAEVSLGYAAIAYNQAYYFDPLNSGTPTNDDGVVILENITRLPNWDVCVSIPSLGDGILETPIDCSAGGNVDVTVNYITGP